MSQDGDARDRRRWLAAVAGALAVLVVIAALLALVVSRGAAGDAAAAETTPPATPSASATSSPTPTGSSPQGPSYRFERVEGRADRGLAAATAALFERRLRWLGATADAEGQGVRVTFVAPPAPSVVEGLAEPGTFELRPVLAVNADPAPFEPPASVGEDEARPTLPSGPSDTDYYLTDDVLTRFARLDCRGGDVPAYASRYLAMPACDAAGTAKYVLGPVVVADDALAGVSLRAQDGGVAVRLAFDERGSSQLGVATTRLAALSAPTNRLAVVVDGVVVSAPEVREAALGGVLVLTGSDRDESYAIAAAVGTGRPGLTWSPAASGR